jgi:hypothetical protein
VVVRIDHSRKNKLIRQIEYANLENLQNIWTPKRLEESDWARRSRAILTIDNSHDNRPMKDPDFAVEPLRRGV